MVGRVPGGCASDEASAQKNLGMLQLRAGVAVCAVLAAIHGAPELSAQEAAQPTAAALPEIVVTSPSPIVKGAPARRPAANVAPAAASPQPKPVQQFPGPQSPSEVDNASDAADLSLSPPPGTLLISDDAFVPVTVVTDRQILATPGANIADALAQRPGVSASTFAPGASRPIIRGLDTYRVRTQENGIGTHDVAALSEDHATPIDPYAADHVEVIRGPATLRYGSQAIGGVVSVENERIPTFIPRGGFSGGVYGGFSSVDNGWDGSFKATAGSGGVAVHADGFKRQADDYDTPQAKQSNSFVDSEGGSAGASLIGSDGFVGVAVARVESFYGIPGEEAAIDLEQNKVLARGEWRLRSGGIEAVRFWFGASDYVHEEVAEEDGSVEVGSRFTNREQEGRSEVQHQAFQTPLGELNGALGVQYGHRNIRAQSFEGTSLLEPAETDSIAGFVFEELSLTPRIRLQGAGRIERTTVDGTGLLDFSDPMNLVPFTGAKDFTPVSASAGALYEFPLGVVARLTGQYVERAPDAAELFSQGLHEATETFEIGNPNLDKERAQTVEFGLKRGQGALRFDGSIYATRYDGFIFKNLTGVRCGDTFDTCGVEDELDQLLFEQRDATFYGLEVAAQYDIAPIWRGVWGFDAQYDFVRAKFDGGENVPRIPPHRLGGGVYYRDGRLFLRAGVLHAFDQDKIGPTETETDGYTLVSAEASYTIPLQRSLGGATPEFTIGLRGDNLADDDVRNHSSFLKDEVLQPGASVRVFGSLKFN